TSSADCVLIDAATTEPGPRDAEESQPDSTTDADEMGRDGPAEMFYGTDAAASDAGAGAPDAAPPDAGSTDAGRAQLAPPRLIAPLSTATVTSQRPTLRWVPTGG